MNAVLFLADSYSPTEENQLKSDSKTSPLCQLNGRSSFGWTARALAQSRMIQTIFVVGEAEEFKKVRVEWPNDARFVEHVLPASLQTKKSDDTDFSAEFGDFLEVLRREGSQLIRNPTLVLDCNRVVLSGADFDAVVRLFNAQNANLDSAAFLIERELARKTLENAADASRIAGENIISFAIIGPRAVAGAIQVAQKLAPAIAKISGNSEKFSKDHFSLTWKVGCLMGFGLAWRIIRRQATPDEIERAVSRILKTRFQFLRIENPNWFLAPSNPASVTQIEKILPNC